MCELPKTSPYRRVGPRPDVEVARISPGVAGFLPVLPRRNWSYLESTTSTCTTVNDPEIDVEFSQRGTPAEIRSTK